MVAAPCWRRSSTYGATSANTIARMPRPKRTEVSDDSPVVACARGARASSSSARASASEMAADATSRRANAASGVRSIGRGTIAATATTAAANGVAFLASDQRIAPRASVIMRQRKISPTIAKRTDRPSQLTSSSWRVGSTYATARLAKRVPMRIAPPRRSVAVSRSAATMMHETPVTAATPPTSDTGALPPENACTIASRHANAIDSVRMRAMMRRPSGSELDRGTTLRRREDFAVHAARGEMALKRRRDIRHRDGHHPVVRAPESDRRLRQTGSESRRNDHERRARWKTAALAQEDGLRRPDRVRAEPREDLEASRERTWSAAECGTRPLVGEVVDPVRHEAHLAAGVRGVPDELGRGGDDELG